MAKQETVTLIWTKAELELVVHCLSLCLPRTPLLVSAPNSLYCCPTCHSEITERKVRYCSQCGQCFEWDKVSNWADELAEYRTEALS